MYEYHHVCTSASARVRVPPRVYAYWYLQLQGGVGVGVDLPGNAAVLECEFLEKIEVDVITKSQSKQINVVCVRFLHVLQNAEMFVRTYRLSVIYMVRYDARCTDGHFGFMKMSSAQQTQSVNIVQAVTHITYQWTVFDVFRYSADT